MRRRWKWPILDWVKALESDDRALMWPLWLLGGFVFAFLPAAVIFSTDKHGDLQMTPVLVWTLVGWLGPLVASLLVVVAMKMPAFAKWFVPKRVTEPVREDLRSRYR